MPSNTKDFHETLRNTQENMRKSSYNRTLQRSGVSSLMPQKEQETIPVNIEEVPQQPVNWLDKIRQLIKDFNNLPRTKTKMGPMVGFVRGEDPKIVKNGGFIKQKIV